MSSKTPAGPPAADARTADADPASDRPEPGPRRRPWWLFLTVFVGGIVVGVLLVGLLSVGTPDFVTSADEAARSESADPRAGGVEVAAQAQVNAACLRVINEAQDVYSALTGLDEAVSDVDLQALDDIVRRLQPVEPRLARDLQGCRVQVGGTGLPEGSASAVVPTPSATVTG